MKRAVAYVAVPWLVMVLLPEGPFEPVGAVFAVFAPLLWYSLFAVPSGATASALPGFALLPFVSWFVYAYTPGGVGDTLAFAACVSSRMAVGRFMRHAGKTAIASASSAALLATFALYAWAGPVWACAAGAAFAFSALYSIAGERSP